MVWSLNLTLAVTALVLAILVLLDVVGTASGLALAVIALAVLHLLGDRGFRIGRGP